ncbi:MAG: GNAT family N-acetyltransferase [Lentisphaeria bacterium]|nr:GNAT family N-acetyltransferase [Lentisphaeria bacterium]
MTQGKYIIRKMSAYEVNIAVDWAAEEGWNPGLHDAVAYMKADPNGFFLGCLDGEPIACISAVKYGESFGFIGFYIVKPNYRGNGYGLQIWNHAMAYLQGVNIGLDGVVDQQENYKKSGFSLAYRNMRFEGRTRSCSSLFPEIVPIDEIPFNSLLNYEETFFPESRDVFFAYWIRQPNSHAFAYVSGGSLLGYGVIRKCRVGYKLAPLYAENNEIAKCLLESLISQVDVNQPYFLDITEQNQGALSLVEELEMKLSFETARMYTKETPVLPIHKIYGIASFEIG